MYNTQEGLHLVPFNQKEEANLNKLEKLINKIDQKALADLQLSDLDYTEFINNKMVGKLISKTCNLFALNLEMFKLTQNRFIKLRDENKNSLILYSNEHVITIPTCISVSGIKIKEKTDLCYKDIPVTFNVNNQEINGFLHKDMILIKNSAQVTCSDIPRTLFFQDQNEMVTIRGKNILIETYNFAKMKLSPKIKDLDKFNFFYSPKVINGINSIDDFLKLSPIKDGDDTILVERDSISKEKEIELNKQSKYNNLLSQIFKIISSLITLIT
jgi:hypothetical protein